MKLIKMFLPAMMFGCVSFTQPVHIVPGLAPLFDNQQMPDIILPINQPNTGIAKKCLSFFKKDLHRYFSLTSVGTAAAFLYLTKDTNMTPFDRVTGSIAAYMVPQLTAGAIALLCGREFFLD